MIPCKFDPARPVIFNCVAGIRKHHPDARILVVDSASEDTSYLAQLDCETVDAENRHYGPGAFKWAFDEYRDESFFYFFFDSLMVNDNLDDCRDHDLTTVRWFDSVKTGWGWTLDGYPLDEWARERGVKIPDRFKGVFGPMVACTRRVAENADLFRLLPSTAQEQCALERCWGIWLQKAGYDPAANCLQGEMLGFHDPYPSDRVEKIAMARA